MPAPRALWYAPVSRQAAGAISPDGSRVFTADADRGRLNICAAGVLVDSRDLLKPLPENLHFMASPDGQTVVASTGHYVTAWRSDGTRLFSRAGSQVNRGIAFSADSKRFVTWTDNSVSVWAIDSIVPVGEFALFGVSDAALSADSGLVILASPRGTDIRSPTGTLVRNLAPTGHVDVRGDELLVAGDGDVSLWSIASGTMTAQTHALAGDGEFLGHSNRIAVRNGSTVRIWDPNLTVRYKEAVQTGALARFAQSLLTP